MGLFRSSEDIILILPEGSVSDSDIEIVGVLRSLSHTLLTKTDVQTVSGVITLKSAVPERPGNIPEGVAGSNIIDTRSALDIRLGLVADSKGLTGLGDRLDGGGPTDLIILNYINTVCLPRENQFSNYRERCWVASWGDRQERQKEIDLPLLTRYHQGLTNISSLRLTLGTSVARG